MPRSGLESFTLHRKGVRKILRSEAVQQDLLRRAMAVKAAADADLQQLTGPYPAVVADVSASGSRARATIAGVPLPLERSDRILGRALDAAR